jgi:hypothetical protein
MIRITLNISGGELESRVAHDEREAADVVAELVLEVGELHDGDTITITQVDGSAA